MDHEMLAIMEALQHWHLYLNGKKFVVQYRPSTIDLLLCTTKSFPSPTMLG